jgi:hypothetical protein
MGVNLLRQKPLELTVMCVVFSSHFKIKHVHSPSKHFKLNHFLRSLQFCSYSRISQYLWNPKVHYRVHKRPPKITNFRVTDEQNMTESHRILSLFNHTCISTMAARTCKLRTRAQLRCYRDGHFHFCALSPGREIRFCGQISSHPKNHWSIKVQDRHA